MWLLAIASHSIPTLHHLLCVSVIIILERKSNPVKSTQNKTILSCNELDRIKSPVWNKKQNAHSSSGIKFDDQED